MSFVERAKELQDWIERDLDVGADREFVLDCLPEIVAVLEAARESMEYCECQNGPCDFCKPVKEALAVLNQKADSGREG